MYMYNISLTTTFIRIKLNPQNWGKIYINYIYQCIQKVTNSFSFALFYNYTNLKSLETFSYYHLTIHSSCVPYNTTWCVTLLFINVSIHSPQLLYRHFLIRIIIKMGVISRTYYR